MVYRDSSVNSAPLRAFQTGANPFDADLMGRYIRALSTGKL